jgi:DeoR/GlpR family transcriptional regulator of sugar metabolism
VGPIGDVLTGRGRINKGFFGVIAISTVHGLMDLSAEEAQTKQFMAKACDQVYGVFDSSKVDGFGLHSFAGVADIDAMFTDDGMQPAAIEQWSKLGVPVHVAGGPGDRSGGRATVGPR